MGASMKSHCMSDLRSPGVSRIAWKLQISIEARECRDASTFAGSRTFHPPQGLAQDENYFIVSPSGPRNFRMQTTWAAVVAAPKSEIHIGYETSMAAGR